MLKALNQIVNQMERQLGPGNSLALELTQILDVSIDTAYRRLRGQSQFSLSELCLLSEHFKFSLDDVINGHPVSRNFHFNRLYEDEHAFSNYLMAITEELERLRKSNGSITFVASELPISQSFQDSLLRRFKVFYWQKVILGQSWMKGIRFGEGFQLGEHSLNYTDRLMSTYHALQKQEIWTEETLDDTLRQVVYCKEGGLFEDHIQLKLIRDALLQLLDRIERDLEHHSELKSNALKFYVCSTELGNNIVLMDFGDRSKAFVKFNTFNTLSTDYAEFCNEIERMVDANLKKSVEISGKSDVIRYQFFETLRNKVCRVLD